MCAGRDFNGSTRSWCPCTTKRNWSILETKGAEKSEETVGGDLENWRFLSKTARKCSWLQVCVFSSNRWLDSNLAIRQEHRIKTGISRQGWSWFHIPLLYHNETGNFWSMCSIRSQSHNSCFVYHFESIGPAYAGTLSSCVCVLVINTLLSVIILLYYSTFAPRELSRETRPFLH